MRLIDMADAFVAIGQVIMVVGFFAFMFGLLMMICGWIMRQIL